MCLICVELSKDKLTPLEARRNLGEMIHVVEEDHRIEVLQAIWKKEDELDRLNEDVSKDEEWAWMWETGSD
tara:strand:- start:93 stop:305 length:213 start_codon:yes stop_codon:yes gene_type:complete